MDHKYQRSKTMQMELRAIISRIIKDEEEGNVNIKTVKAIGNMSQEETSRKD